MVWLLIELLQAFTLLMLLIKSETDLDNDEMSFLVDLGALTRLDFMCWFIN